MRKSKSRGKGRQSVSQVRATNSKEAASVASPLSDAAPSDRGNLDSFLSALSFRAPERVVPSAWHEHAPFAFWLVELLKPEMLVELGTHHGFSYFAFCQAIRMAGLSTAAFAVDRWTGDEHAGYYGEEVYQDVEAFNVERYPDISTLLRMPFSDALAYFEDGSIDLLHIDGRHFYDDVKADFESWLPKLSDRSVVLFHDTNVREREFGVHRLWSELCEQYPNFSFLHGHGLGVLGVGKDCPPNVSALFKASSDLTLTASIRNAYARLGGAVTLSFRASEARQQQALAQSSVGELTDALRRRDEELQQALNHVAEVDELKRSLEQAISKNVDLAAQSEGLPSSLASVRLEGEQLRTEQASLLQRLSDLSDEYERLRADAEGKVAELKEAVERAHATLSAERQKAAEQADQFSEAEEHRRVAEANYADAAAEAAQLRTERASLLQRLSDLSDEYERLRADAEGRIAELNEAVERAHATLSAERQKAAEQAEQLSEVEEHRRVAEANYAGAAAEAAQLRLELAVQARIAAEQSAFIGSLRFEQSRTEEGKTSLTVHIDELKRALSAEREGRTAALDRVQELEGELGTRDKELRSLEEEVEAIRKAGGAASAASKQAISTLEDKVDALHRSLDEKSVAEARYLSAEQQWRLQLDQREIELTRVSSELDEARRRKHGLEQEIQTLKRSPLYRNRGIALGLRRLVSTAWRLIRYGSVPPLFDEQWYLQHYPDLAEAGIDPYFHYLAFGAAEGRFPNPLFDTSWYLEQCPDVRDAGVNPLVHYLRYGAIEGRDPSPLFDSDWYLEQYQDVRAAGVNPLVHYLRYGAIEGRNPSPPFDSDWYLEQYPDVRAAGVNPLVHYLRYGAIEGRNPSPPFDSDWYLEQYPDVRAAGVNPLVHYLRYGAIEGRDPSPLFDSDWYLEQYPDVRAAGVNPLVHYLRYGAVEGRDPHPLFDSDWYLEQYPDVRAAGVNPLVHYLRYGAVEGRDPNPLFDSDWYLEQYPDVRAAGVNPLVHYLRYGAVEGRDPNPLFDSDWYLEQHPDVRAAGVNPLVHYLVSGAGEGRDPNPMFDSDWYLEKNPDVCRAGMNPLVHYLQHGAAEGRNPTPAVMRPGNSILIAHDRIDCYSAWLVRNALHDRAVQALHEALSARRGRLPRISIVMPVYNTPTALLDQTISSVVGQIYNDWELCIADDASGEPHVSRDLARWAAVDSRIRTFRLDRNGGIAVATNAASALATGEFLAFLDHDDILTPDALAEVAIYAADHPGTDVIYSDDDKVDMDGHRFAPQFKPDWSPTLLLSSMYMGHLLVLRRSLFESIGAIRTGFDGSQDYDLALRATERAQHIGHIPRILYHWRVVPGSVAATTDAKPHSIGAGLRAVADAFARRGIEAVVDQPDWARAAKIGVYSATFPDDGPQVSILIPTRNRLDLLRACVTSLTKTTYRNYEVVILDNDSDDPATRQFLSTCGHRVLRIPSPDGKFSFAHMNNVGVRQVETDYVLLLNNDTEVINPRWLSQMMGYARMPGIGAVGAKLLYRDKTIQHNGIVHGYHDGMAGHAFKNLPADGHGYLEYLKVPREYSGATAACLLTPRALFLEQGGLDEATFAVAYNDVDYCYRLIDAGYRCVVCPDAELYHDEGKSRGFEDNPKEVAAMRTRYRGRIDPYYNSNLSLDNEHFEIRPYRRPMLVREPIRTIVVSHNLNHEGAPNSQYEMIAGLKRRGVIDPVVLSPCDGPLRSRYEAAGIPVELVSVNVSGKTQFDRTTTMLARAFRESGGEIVYCNTLQTFWAIAAAEDAQIPALWNVRESESWQSYFDFLSPDVRACAYASFRYPYRVVFVAHATRRAWNPLNTHHNFATIHNGLDMGRLQASITDLDRTRDRIRLGIAESELAVVLLGTVCERKGQLDLVQALPLLPPELWSRLRLFIVGDRPGIYSDRLHAEAAALPAALRDRLIVVPETGEPHQFLNVADIAVCCSRIESYPRVTLEAMAFGLPLITTPVFGISEQIREGVNGLFYQPGDASELARHLARLGSDNVLRSRLASNGPLVLAALPGLEEMLDGYERLFQEARLSGSGH